jgi:hypothetical protein
MVPADRPGWRTSVIMSSLWVRRVAVFLAWVLVGVGVPLTVVVADVASAPPAAAQSSVGFVGSPIAGYHLNEVSWLEGQPRVFLDAVGTNHGYGEADPQMSPGQPGVYPNDPSVELTGGHISIGCAEERVCCRFS